MEKRGIIFDLDGTLVDSIEDLGDAANMLFRKHGYPEHTTPEFIRWIGNGARKFIEQGIGSVIDINDLQDYVKEFKEIYANNLAVKTRLYPGIKDLLDELTEQNIRMSLLSNKPHLLTLEVARHYLSEWPLELIIGQQDDKPRKPDPTVPLAMADMMKIEPEDILFIGDSPGDIKTAVSAGMIPVGVSWGYGNLEQAVNDGHSVLDNPAEILNLLYKN